MCEPLVPTIQLWQHAQMLTSEQLAHAFEPVFVDIRERASVWNALSIVICSNCMATLWVNVVLSPEEAESRKTICQPFTI